MAHRLLPLLALLFAGEALAAPPVRAAVLVVAAPGVPEVTVARTRADTRGVLLASGGLALQDEGIDAAALQLRCGDEARCWRGAAAALGLEQLIVMELREEGEVVFADCRVLTGDASPQRGSAPLPRGGGAPLELLQSLLLDPGALALQSATPGLKVSVDARPVSLDGGPLSLPPGKHVVRVEADGHYPSAATLIVLSGRTLDFPVALTPIAAPPPSRRWRRAAAAMAVAATGAGLAATLLALPSPAARPLTEEP